jgi:hypothetical protein
MGDTGEYMIHDSKKKKFKTNLKKGKGKKKKGQKGREEKGTSRKTNNNKF